MTVREVTLGGHFGEWLQGRIGPHGPVALITMPCAAMGVRARLRPGGDALWLRGVSEGTRAIAARFVADLGLKLAGEVCIQPRAAPGLGTGVSTASLLALARLAGWQGTPDALARACVRAEGASDPLMFPAPERLLWASREGRVLANLPALPGYEALGGFHGEARPTDPADQDFPDISDLVAQWPDTSDLAGFAALASVSASRCLARRGPAQDPTAALASRLGALGWAMAYTGAARALIFAPGCVPSHGADALCDAGLRDIVRFTGGGE